MSKWRIYFLGYLLCSIKHCENVSLDDIFFHFRILVYISDVEVSNASSLQQLSNILKIFMGFGEGGSSKPLSCYTDKQTVQSLVEIGPLTSYAAVCFLSSSIFAMVCRWKTGIRWAAWRPSESGARWGSEHDTSTISLCHRRSTRPCSSWF